MAKQPIIGDNQTRTASQLEGQEQDKIVLYETKRKESRGKCSVDSNTYALHSTHTHTHHTHAGTQAGTHARAHTHTHTRAHTHTHIGREGESERGGGGKKK